MRSFCLGFPYFLFQFSAWNWNLFWTPIQLAESLAPCSLFLDFVISLWLGCYISFTSNGATWFLMSPWLPYPRQIRPPLALSLTKLQFNMLLCKLQFELLTSLPVLLNHASCPSLQAVFEIIVHLKVKLTQDTACSIIVIKHTKLKIHSPALNELIIFIK